MIFVGIPAVLAHTRVYPKVSGLSHNKITINTRCEATERVTAAKLIRHKISIQLHSLAENCIIFQFSLQTTSPETF
jgi:hypothetical protein